MRCHKTKIHVRGVGARCAWRHAVGVLVLSAGSFCAQANPLGMGVPAENAFPRQHMVLAKPDRSGQPSVAIVPRNHPSASVEHDQEASRYATESAQPSMPSTHPKQQALNIPSNVENDAPQPLPAAPHASSSPSLGSVLQQMPMALLQHSDDVAFSHWINACQHIATDMFTFSASHLSRDKHRLSSFFMPKAWAVLEQALFLSPQAFLRSALLEQQHDTLGVGVDAPALHLDGSYSPSGRQRALFETTVMAVEYAKPFQKRVFKVQMQVAIARPGDRQNGWVLVESVNIQPMSDWGQGVQV